MIAMDLLVFIVGIHLMALAVPGPDFYIILRASYWNNQSKSLCCVLGITASVITHLLLVYLGFSLIIVQSPTLYTIVMLAGALWLLRIAWFALRAQKDDFNATVKRKDQTVLPTFSCFLLGYCTNLLNPKALIYFISIIAQVVRPDENQTTYFFVASLLIALTFLWFVMLVKCLGQPWAKHLTRNYGYLVERVFGVLIIVLVFSMFFYNRAPLKM